MVLSNAQWFANPGVAYEIDQSCRFNDDDTASMQWATTDTPTSTDIGTISVWLKRGNLGITNTRVWNKGNSATPMLELIFMNTDKLMINGDLLQSISTQTFRDPSAWYNIVVAVDTSQGVAANRIKIYVNGTQITAWDAEDWPDQNDDIFIGTDWWIGRWSNATTHNWDGYLSEVVYADGTAYAASDFGETNSTTGQWVPKDVSGLTFGDNGFLLAFQDSSALGDDTSGNGNDFTSSGLAANDQVVDTPTNNFCTWNPVNPQPAASNTIVLSDGNLNLVNGSAANQNMMSTHQLHGKQYMEIKLISSSNAAGTRQTIGVIEENTVLASGYMANSSDTFSGMAFPYLVSYSDGTSDPAEPDYGALADGETLGFAVSEDDGKFWCRVDDGDWLGGGDPETTTSTPTGTFSNITTGQWVSGVYNTSDQNTSDFGQLGYAYTAPSGYETVSTANLADPTIADPSAYFQTTLYTGNGSTQSIDQGGNSTFSPNLVWIKNRDAADNHCWFDTVRGATELLSSNNTDAESTDADTLTAFDSDGFSLGDDDKVNTSGESYVGWQWLESATPGFDMVSYTGNGTLRTISHSLGVKPDLMIFKRRDGTQNWGVYHSAITADYVLNLDLTNAKLDDAATFNDTEPTSSVFTVNTDGKMNANTQTYIAWLFAGVEGFSKFGSYTGNGSATDGPFIWLGFRPAYFLFKRTDSADNWRVYDNQRGPFNEDDARLEPNGSGAEASGDGEGVDFLSNGLKIKSSDSGWNASGGTYIFWAFADTPFKTATAR